MNPMTPALDALATALGDVDNLIQHHPKAVNPSPGRPTGDEGPLLRSCILLTYAAWEVYIENSLIWAVEELANRSSPSQLPEALREFVAAAVRSDSWTLSGDGWRDATKAVVKVRVRGDEDNGSFGMNTAGPGQIIALHEQVLGTNLLNECGWHMMRTDRIKTELASLIEIRGCIAHTGQALGPLELGGVREWRAFVQRLAGQIDRQLEQWVADYLPEEVSIASH
jgi:RiboL-PSP-HEPN